MYGIVEFSDPKQPVFMDFVFDNLDEAKAFSTIVSNRLAEPLYVPLGSGKSSFNPLANIKVKVFKFEVLE